MTYDTYHHGDQWHAHCNTCGEHGHTDKLSQLAGWMAQHRCTTTKHRPERGTT